ncbi:tagaturonate reductase [Cesiribacter sp. SM1]|uniref:tagaturonate reductase n=1 Tax=Cesiribacter sp. SM1 TaxID=2861196 RepID=UPI001CD31A98|nr:tagaturonate reductase [Cesiribacter sp. SM1]
MKTLNRHTANVPLQFPVKVLQFGEGNFLRGFVNWMIDLMNEKAGFAGSVQVVQPIEQGIVHLINEQDGLYHLLLNGISGGKPVQEQRLISCIAGGINPYGKYNEYLALGENPDLEFVISNTTEAGIAFVNTDVNMDSLPDSFPGKLTALLYHRFKYFNGAADKALTIIPCELIDKNGEALRNAILQYARHWELPQSFSSWITEHTVFCNTLVDRIVPGFPRENIKEIQQELGYEDKLVVKAEPFHLWVIEGPDAVKDAFPADKAGLQVKYVKDQSPYRTRKVRILNGAHTALVPVAYLQGLRTVREAVEDKQAGNFIREAIFKEIIPTLDLPEEELEQFANDVIERFQNPFIRHELISIALNSVSKYKVRVLPSVLEYHKRSGKLPEMLLHSLAALILFYKGSWGGETIALNDAADVIDFFREAWKKEKPAATVEMVLANKDFWNMDLTQISGLSEMVSQQLQVLQQQENKASVKAA